MGKDEYSRKTNAYFSCKAANIRRGMHMFDAISLYQWWRTTISDIEDIPKPEKRWLSATRRASDRTDMPSMAISPAFRVTLTIRQLAAYVI